MPGIRLIGRVAPIDVGVCLGHIDQRSNSSLQTVEAMWRLKRN